MKRRENMQDLKELNEVIAAIKEEIRQGADALTTSRSVYEFKKTFLDNKQGRIGLLMKEMRNDCEQSVDRYLCGHGI